MIDQKVQVLGYNQEKQSWAKSNLKTVKKIEKVW